VSVSVFGIFIVDVDVDGLIQQVFFRLGVAHR
jgi:hypothetical protein